MSLRARKKTSTRRKQKKDIVKFHAEIDKNTGFSLYQRDGGLYLIIKKDLVDYNLSVSPSEAPIINQYLKHPDPFEVMLADIKIIEKELVPYNISIHTSFGDTKEMTLISVRLGIGSGENEYVTIDESDLFKMDVEPTIGGLIDFVDQNDSVVGISNRHFDAERGNIIIMEAKLQNPAKKISSIELKIISSLQQRGLYMQKNMKYAGLQMYTIIKAESLTDELLDFLKDIGIDWEIIFFRRDLAIEDWMEIECEKNSINLKGFLNAKYQNLGFFDVNNITRIAVINQLNFKVVNRTAELLDRTKGQKLELIGGSPDNDPLKKAEIYAAAKLSCAYFGIKKDLILDKGITMEEILVHETKLIEM